MVDKRTLLIVFGLIVGVLNMEFFATVLVIRDTTAAQMARLAAIQKDTQENLRRVEHLKGLLEGVWYGSTPLYAKDMTLVYPPKQKKRGK